MNVKREIGEAFTPPKPKFRGSFLKNLSYPKLTYPEFILSQICYIRKRIWLISSFVLLIAIGIVCIIPERNMTIVWGMSAIMPFLALMTASEISRSDMFGMCEIETSCRFSLRQVVGARMMILFICNFVLIACIAVISGIFSPFSIAKSALYMVAPYITVNGISLAVFNNIKGEDGMYFSAAISLIVSLMGIIAFWKNFYAGMYSETCMVGICIISAALMIAQIKKYRTERTVYYGVKN